MRKIPSSRLAIKSDSTLWAANAIGLLFVTIIWGYVSEVSAQHLHGSINPDAAASVVLLGIHDLNTGARITDATSAGDFDGDGIGDIAFRYHDNGLVEPGKVYVLYGAELESSSIDIGAIGTGTNTQGVVFDAVGLDVNTSSHEFPVSAAGDIDGDGVGDLLIGKGRADTGRGEAYLIYGNVRTINEEPIIFGEVELREIGTTQAPSGVIGAKFFGRNGDTHVGASFSPAGDVNGDGYDDFLLGAPATDHPNKIGAGAGDDSGFLYLVTGRARTVLPENADPNQLLAHLSEIKGLVQVDGTGNIYDEVVITGCGCTDSLLAAIASAPPNESEANAKIYSRPAFEAVFIGDIQSGGIGRTLSAGDINGDGETDFLVGHDDWQDDPNLSHEPFINRAITIHGTANGHSGTSFVEAVGVKPFLATPVSTEPVDAEYRPPSGEAADLLDAVEGTVFLGGTAGSTGTDTEDDLDDDPVSFLGDINGDDIGDFALGRYLLFGKAGTEYMDAAELVEFSFPTLDRSDPVVKLGRVGTDPNIGGVQFGDNVLPAGDFNGDGLADFRVGEQLIYGTTRMDWLLGVDPNTGQLSIDPNDLASLGAGLDGISFGLADPNYQIRLDSVGDVNADGLGDVVITSTNFGAEGQSFLVYGVQRIPGDIDADGDVDGDDLNLMLVLLNQPISAPIYDYGDFDGDGSADPDDLNELLVNFGSGGTGSVPEPSAVMLVCMAMCLCVGCGRFDLKRAT